MEEEAYKKSQRLILDFNKSGMQYLSHDQYRESLEFLKKAERLIEGQLRLRDKDVQLNRLYGITLNNLGCYYKKTNKPKVALKYLKRALEIEVYNVEDWIATAGTHLNICAIFSFMGKYQYDSIADISKPRIMLDFQQSYWKGNAKQQQESNPTLNNTLMISYYNMGVELEYLRKYIESCQAYKQGLEVAKITKRGDDMQKVLEESIVRTTQAHNSHEKRVLQLLEKRKEQEEKGHCEFMRKNKKHQLLQPIIDNEIQPLRYAEYSQPQLRSISTTERLAKGISEVRILRKLQNRSHARQHLSGEALPSTTKQQPQSARVDP